VEPVIARRTAGAVAAEPGTACTSGLTAAGRGITSLIKRPETFDAAPVAGARWRLVGAAWRGAAVALLPGAEDDVEAPALVVGAALAVPLEAPAVALPLVALEPLWPVPDDPELLPGLVPGFVPLLWEGPVGVLPGLVGVPPV
jgi:hypothetical protein